jgi:hypothetical protein
MDHTDKWFWIQSGHSWPDFPVPESAPPIQHKGWQVWDRQEKVTDPPLSNLYDLLQKRPTQMWWVRHERLPKDHLDNVDWYGTERFMVSLPPAKCCWVTKTASHNCGVGTTLLHWKYQDDAACPGCGAPKTTLHMYWCNGEDADTVWDSSMEKVSSYLDKSHTDPSLSSALIICLSLWQKSRLIHMSDIAPPPVRHVVAQQHALGRHHMFEGVVVKRQAMASIPRPCICPRQEEKVWQKLACRTDALTYEPGPKSVAPSQFYQAHYKKSSTPMC